MPGETLDEAPPLLAGEKIRRRMAPGETHVYSLVVSAGDYLELVTIQDGIDVKTVLVDSEGEEMIRVDRPIGPRGPETLIALAETAGTLEIRISPAGRDQPPRSYEISVHQLRPATAADLQKAAAALTFHRARTLQRARQYVAAKDAFDQALAAWRDIEDPFWQAETLYRLGSLLLSKASSAADYSAESAALYAGLDLHRMESMARLQRAGALAEAGRTDEATDEYDKALALRNGSEDPMGLATAVSSVGDFRQRLGQIEEALKLYQQASELSAGKGSTGARVSHSLGILNYRAFGDFERALRYFEDAEEAYSRLGLPQAATLHQKGRVLLLLERPEAALAAHQDALAIRRGGEGLRRGEAQILTSLGEALEALEDSDGALESYREALEIQTSLPEPWVEARVRRALGRLLEKRSQFQAAKDSLERSVELYRTVGDRLFEAYALFDLARVESALDQHEAARATSESGIEIAEALLPGGVTDRIRRFFFATFQPHFDFHIDLLMQLGDDAGAFEASERARARSLLFLLAEAGVDLRSQADPRLLAEEQRLLKKIAAGVNRLSFQRMDARDRAEIEHQLRELRDRFDRVGNQIRYRDPGYADLTRPQPLRLEPVQSLLRDEDTTLLEYRLGDRRSFGWLVTGSSLTSFELPAQGEIEAIVRRAYGLLQRSHRRESRGATHRVLCELSSMLVGPVADQLAPGHLRIVADDALQYLSFATLPDPAHLDDCHTAPPLLHNHEISYLPSASALAALQRERSQKPRPTGLVAVIADPVFSPRDLRVRPDEAEGPGDPRREDPRADIGRYRRLMYSRDEGEAILDLVAPEESFHAFGFDANKSLVMSDVLGQYRILHFATHATLDTERPEDSALIFSRVDSQGREQDGLLLAPEVYTMRLAADLVVLSGCGTALGEEVRGESLVGLTRGFMYAGADQLLVSLWEVSDYSTSVLMRKFYSGLLKENLPPEKALRQAQLAMWSESYAPFHWGAFTLRGDSR